MENICIEGYRGYISVCERHGIESVSFYEFIGQLTEEQIKEYSKFAL